jgi:hypothetical protein
LRCCDSTSGELPLSPSKNLCALLLLLSTDHCQETSLAHQKNLIITIIIIITTSVS